MCVCVCACVHVSVCTRGRAHGAYMQVREKEAKNLAKHRECLGKVGGRKGKGVNVIILQFLKNYERAM